MSVNIDLVGSGSGPQLMEEIGHKTPCCGEGWCEQGGIEGLLQDSSGNLNAVAII